MLVIKEFKTIDQQIDILRKKGLIIDDEARTYDILLKENYFLYHHNKLSLSLFYTYIYTFSK